MDRDTDTGLIERKQTGLTGRIIETLGLDVGTVNWKATPALNDPLVKDIKGLSSKGDFSYARVVGMLLYLLGHACLYIAYAVNCCTCYMFCPKWSHKEAIERID